MSTQADALRRHRERVAASMHARREDIAFMAATGESFVGAAERLGVTVDALEKWCRLNGMRNEARVLRSRDPIEVVADLSERGKAGEAARWAS